MTNQNRRLSSISVFFPCYNDAGTIASLVISAFKTLRSLTDDYEVIVVDDASEDFSREILEELKTHYKNLKVIYHTQNKGYGGALRSGFACATKDFIFYTDGDGQYDPRELALLVPEMVDGVDIVNGFKIQRHDPFYRIIIGKIYYILVKNLFRLKVKDVDCDFRLIRREVFDKIELESDDGAICVEMVKKLQNAGFVFKEVPVNHYHRVCGRSQVFVVHRILKGGITVLKLWWKICLKPFLARKNLIR